MRKTAEAPHLRIRSDKLWVQVKARQEQTACPHGPDMTPFWAKQRAKYLLTGKVMCGVCGSNYGKVGKLRLGCHANTNYGEVGRSDKMTIRIDEIEEQVLAPLKDDMLQPDAVKAFVKEMSSRATGSHASASVVMVRTSRNSTVSMPALSG